MRLRLHPAQLALGLALVCAGILVLIYWLRLGAGATPPELVSFLPREDSTLVYIDVAAIRASGLLDLLAGSPSVQDADYRSFVDQTHFDYRSDLDAAAASFENGDEYFILRGRFDWAALIAYVNRQGGSCGKSFCRLDASRPGRHISFYPVRKNLMALAVAADGSGAARIVRGASPTARALPSQPAWTIVPASALQSSQLIPDRARPFTAALQDARQVVLALTARSSKLALDIDVACKDPSAATVLEAQLEEATAGLQGMLQREHGAPDPAGLTGMLTSGSFHHDGDRVSGEWPVSRQFLEAIAEGRANAPR